MEPWEAYGTSDMELPEIRICLNTPKDWRMPDDEIHQGITSITIRIHGDDPSLAFVHVHGIEEDAVRVKWLNAKNVWDMTKVRDLIWGPQ